MKTFLKFILWVVVLGGVVYGGFYAYDNWWNEGTANKISNEAKVLGAMTSEKTVEYAKAIASTTRQTATSFVKNKIGDFISVVGEQITSAGLNLSGSTSSYGILPQVLDISSLPVGNLPAPTSSAFGVPPPPATIVVKTNELLSFSVNSGQVYKIDWGDGLKNQGATEAGKTTIVSHAWKNEGDYVVNVSVGNSVSTNVYSFPVRAYK